MPPIHLPPIMTLNAFYRLAEAVAPAVLMIWMMEFMFVKYHARTRSRVLRTMQVPVVSGVTTLNRNIHLIRHHDIEIR